MKKQSVNEAFKLLDNTLKNKREYCKSVQRSRPDWHGSIGDKTDHDPEGKKYIKSI